jgi:hypothetical protein
MITNGNYNTWCGLMWIWNGWKWSSSSATVANDGSGLRWGNPTWTLSMNSADAGAFCATTPSGENLDTFYSVYVSPTNPTTGPLTLPSGTICFLTEVEGSFPSGDFGNGAGWSVVFNQNNTSTWTLTANNGKSATGLCIH